MDISSGWKKLNLDLAGQDIVYLYEKHGIHRFAFTDNDFGGTNEECLEREKSLHKNLRHIDNNISLSINIRSETLTEESITLLHKSGVKVFLIGVESFHPKNIKKYMVKRMIWTTCIKWQNLLKSTICKLYQVIFYGMPGKH